MSKHIGIVACSAQGAALCYHTICSEAGDIMGKHEHPEISMHTPPLAKYVERLELGDMKGVAELMLLSARKLFACGAQFLICPDNTLHQAYSYVQKISPLPWLHIAEVVAEVARTRGYTKLGLLGTPWLIRSDVYPEQLSRLGFAMVRPNLDQIDEMGRIIMDELVQGIVTPTSTKFFQEVVEDFKKQGCDAVILGCTEIPLILNDHNSALPTLDSTRLLAGAALRYSLI